MSRQGRTVTHRGNVVMASPVVWAGLKRVGCVQRAFLESVKPHVRVT